MEYMDISKTGLLNKGKKFTLIEGVHIHEFEWLSFDSLTNQQP